MLDKFVPSKNYPNLFNHSTTIKFALAEMQTVELVVYDVLGNEVAVSFNGKAKGEKYMNKNSMKKIFRAEFIFTVLS